MARYLMCSPEYFRVEYVINPWMQGKVGSVEQSEAQTQWYALYHLLTDTLGAQVEVMPPQPNLPDIVFTANAALIRGRTCVPARFRFAERRGEEPYYRAWLQKAGYDLRDLPEGIAFEGAGDALFYETDAPSPLIWAACEIRTDRAAHSFLAEAFGVEVVSLRLATDQFYHLDTCFCPLPGGSVLWHPPAFDEDSRRLIEERLPEEKRIVVGDGEAADFACNAVAVGANLVMNRVSEELRTRLAEQGFTVYTTPLTEFIKAGGSAKCLTLRCD